MHKCVAVVGMLALSGCGGKKAADVTAGSGSGSGSATAVTTVAGSGSGTGTGTGTTDCFALATGMLESFVADDKTATMCEKLEPDGKPAVHQCLTVDLATGAWSKGAPTPAKPAAIEYKQDDKAVQACTGGACVTLDLAKLPKPDGDYKSTYSIHASADGKKFLAVGGAEKKGIVLLDATGKRLKVFPMGDHESECLEDAQFVGDTIYAMTSVCAGPGGTGYLLTPDGKKFATIDSVNVYSAQPLQVDGDRWAFSDFGGGNFTIWDVKAGKEVRTVKIDRPDDCDDCTLVDGANTVASPLVKTPGGKLVTIGIEGITVVDPQTGAPVGKTRRIPMCVPKPPPPAGTPAP